MSLKLIAERLKKSYSYIIYPAAMGDMPIELQKMAKYEDENDAELITGYYSINELSIALGDLFTPVPYIMDGLMLIRWAFDEGVSAEGVDDRTATRDLLLSKGLTDMRAGIKEAKDIPYETLVGAEFGIFGSYEIGDVQKYVPVDMEEEA